MKRESIEVVKENTVDKKDVKNLMIEPLDQPKTSFSLDAKVNR